MSEKKSIFYIFCLRIFTWWNYAPFSTWLFTLWRGELVGEDIFGNKYYQHKHKNNRWVVYRGLAEPSLVPAIWHGWLHHMTDKIPDYNETSKQWQKDHLPNLTGTQMSYKPSGSLNQDTVKRQASGADYQSWKPDQE